jgi:hypothetical protein
MTYEQVKGLKPAQFKRLCGVRPETFEQMVRVVHGARQEIPFSFLESVSAGGGAYLLLRLVGLARITTSPHLRLPLEEPFCPKTEGNQSIAKVQALFFCFLKNL